MTPVLLAIALGTASGALATGGPWLLRRAAPALVRVPRLAVALAGGGIVVWLATVLAIGPVLAWAGSGPVLLPERAEEVCQRCLAADSPFAAGTADPILPAVVLLAAPAVLVVALIAGLTVQMRVRAQRSRKAARHLGRRACRRQLLGHDVLVTDADHPFALTFPVRHGGIVVSTGALHALDDAELSAVLAHEDAHLHQRHHLVSALVASTASLLGWVPLVSAAAEAIPHYLEIAADNRARHHAGTPALVSALVKLGERAAVGAPAAASAYALHAAGPERIRQLVQPGEGYAGALPAVLVTGYLMALAVGTLSVFLPYASASLTGCT